ncbi:protein kinase and WD40 domains [Halomicronema hongdechloris C2206]|uniref:Protein kinase and WD40 domains n=1 Tax=Halomicronema hongdechloris C2206 TaxID=1641165 RepID=A0A1Z3HSC6_9CYAN|nr:serine/threonine-protein kinase [Halomicronema hongdechloris]ASC73213.1 protein kinase and WD40 domains [Halomicronema hongdechloris C2206]
MTTLCLNIHCPQPQNPETGRFCRACGHPLELGDRYRPIECIGQGGFGRTLLALDQAQTPPQHCVIKQLLPASGGVDVRVLAGPPPDLSRRFRHEVAQLQQLGQHPQIPALLDFFDLATGQFLVQDYIEGRHLDQVLAQAGAFRERQVRRLLADILPVLQHIHQHQIIHRDIKPTNLIAPRSGGPIVLVDFGASKYASDAAQGERTGTVIGSAAYVAPEQALGKAVFASDLYSLGVTCIHLLTGLHPFELYSVSEGRWHWRTYVQSPVSLKLARILDRMLARGLRERYATAAAVLADLDRSPQPSLPGQRQSSTSVQVSGSQPSGRDVVSLAVSCRTLTVPSGVVINTLAVSPQQRLMVTGAANQTVQLWDLDQGESWYRFGKRLGPFGEGHRDAVTAVLFHPDGNSVFSGSQDGVIKWWDLASGDLIETLPQIDWGPMVLTITPDGRWLISAAGEGKIHLWDLVAHRQGATLTHHRDRVNALTLAAQDQLISSGEDGTIRLWQLPQGWLLRTLTVDQAVTSLAANANRRVLFSGNHTGQLQTWQLQTWVPQLLGEHRDTVTTLSLSPNGHWLASGSGDGTLFVWAAATKQRVATLRHDWAVRAAVFAPDNRTLISSSADETVRIWCLPAESP